MNLQQTLSVVIGLVLFIPLGLQILRGQAKQNIATFILWGSMDGIVAISTYILNGNYQLPTAYALGSAIIVLCILKSRNFDRWTWFETVMTIMVIICLVIWKISGPYWATIMSSIALVLASTPMVIKDSWMEPEKFPTLLYSGYSLANFFGILGGKSWSVEERFYPVCAFSVCVTMVLISLRKYRFSAASN